MKGPWIVLKSCVPIATSVRLRQMFWWSLSCRSMKESYRAWSNLIPRSTAHTTNGRTRSVSGLTVIFCRGAPFAGSINRNVGDGHRPMNTFNALEIPSWHRRSYRFAGMSIL